jgi:CBS-domain-containing membrane protein
MNLSPTPSFGSAKAAAGWRATTTTKENTMQAQDIMTKPVLSVGPDTPIDDVASLMLENHISAVPVLDAEGVIVGLVSEGDLMRRVQGVPEMRHSWWLSLLANPVNELQDYVVTHGRFARDVMTRDVKTIGPEMAIGDIAILLEKSRIKRVPVIDDGKLVGIVSRANLLQGLISVPLASPRPDATDRALRDAVIVALQSIPNYNPVHINVTVQDRDAKVWGIANSSDEEAAVRVAAESVEGLRSVDVHLGRVPAWAWGI